MFTVSEYLKKLLFEQDCVVVPELGGFITHANHSFYSEQNSLYFPLSRKVAFNEALKLDDGLITHYIAVNEGISRDEAQLKIQNFVKEIKITILQEGEYVVDGLGKILSNLEGKFYFESQPDANFHEDGYGLKAINVKMANTQVAVIENKTDWEAQDRVGERDEFEPKLRTRAKKAAYVSGLLLVGALFYANNGLAPSESFKSSLNPFEIISSHTTSSNIQNEPSISIAAPVQPVLKQVAIKPKVVISNAGENKEVVKNKEKVEFRDNSKIEEAIEKKVPIISEETNKKEMVESSPEVIKNARPLFFESEENAKFFVIAGAFGKEENATKLVSKLKEVGYKNAYVMNIDERKLYKVSAVGLSTQQSALSLLSKVNKISKANAWILHVD